jgi:hypothetical protein
MKTYEVLCHQQAYVSTLVNVGSSDLMKILIVILHYLQNILDAESWIFNLNEANTNTSQNPTWFKSYSFKEEYGVGSLSAIELDKLTHILAGNISLLQKYSR